MRKEKVFLGYDENNKEIVMVKNVYTKDEMIFMFETLEKELKEGFTCIDMQCPRNFEVDIEVIKQANEDDEFILNHVTKQIEMLVC